MVGVAVVGVGMNACRAEPGSFLPVDNETGGAGPTAGTGAGLGQGGGGLFGVGGGTNTNTVSIGGRVLAPTGEFPIAGALVWLTNDELEPIPSGVYHYECDTLDGERYALSAPDGTFTIDGVVPGTYQLVTRKGNFRRVRSVEITADGQMIPEELTTLPRASSADGLDTIPSFAVVRTSPDKTYNLLAKFGLGDVDPSGELIAGTEAFDMYADASFQGYPHTSALFDSQAVLDSYHHIFLPCFGSSVGVNFVNTHAPMLREFVAKGGKLYNSCTVSLWSEAAFPPYIDFYQDDDPTRFDIGRRTNSAYTTTGETLDPDLGAWLEVVSPASATSVPFQNGYVTIDATVEVDDGHGLEEDGGVVKPFTWVQDNGAYPGSPLMVTYPYDFGKVFYSVYETSSDNVTITPQEFVLLYVILEVGVCENLPPGPPR